MRRNLSALIVTGSLLAVPATSLAQNNPGFSFNWGGDLPRKAQLGYRLDNGRPNVRDRYQMRVRPQKMEISKLYISYPDYYRGTFDPEKIELFVKDKQVPLTESRVDKVARLIEITPEAVVPAENKMEVVLSGVKNPSGGGMYYFNARVDSPGDVPIARYIGTWVVSIFKD